MTLPDTLSDEEIVHQILAGRPTLFELVVRRHNQRLYRVARSVVRDDHEAEDIVQNAYVAAFTRLASFEGRASFATWLTRITLREALMHTRKRREVVPTSHLEPNMPDPRHGPEADVASLELGRLMEIEIDALPDAFRTVFMLRAVQGLSIAETSACLAIAEPTVKSRLHRAKRLLRSGLATQLERATPRVHAFAGHRCDRITAAVMARVLQTP